MLNFHVQHTYEVIHHHYHCDKMLIKSEILS